MEKLRITANPLLHVVVLSIIVWLVFARTLGSYFLADDFGEIAYASHIFAGDYSLLWADFTSNFMRVPGMAVWRPWLMVSLFTDFCLWRASAFGYYLTNLLSYNVVVVLFYWLIYTLSGSHHNRQNNKQGALVALLSAALFAASPLHCESVSWVVGRVDIVCAVFYLACLIFSVVAERNTVQYRRYISLAVLCFWLAMWTKEMAIGAPVMVTAIYLLFGQTFSLRRAFKLAAPLWISTVVYFILRFLALGTILGGYVQGIGDSQAANALSRWLDVDTLKRLFFPLAENVFGSAPWQQPFLQICYVILAVLIVLRLASLTISIRWSVFILIWLITCLAPIYKLWGLGFDLEGGRFCFFLTMPLAMLAPSLILLQGRRRKLPNLLANTVSIIGAGAVATCIVVLGKAAYSNNLEWVHAGQEVRELVKQARALPEAGTSKISILGIPKRRGGAHMILNGNTFTTALKPPFTDKDRSGQFVTFDPIQFSEAPFIDSTRFKRLAGNKILVWHSPERKFVHINYLPANATPAPVELAMSSSESGYTHRLGGVKLMPVSNRVILSNIAEGDSLAFHNLRVNPLSVDYLEADVTVLDKISQPVKLGVSINDKGAGHYQSKGIIGAKKTLIRVPVSRDWHWYSQPTIESLFLLLPPGREIELSNCRLVPASAVAPVLQIDGGQESYEGVVSAALRRGKLKASVQLPVTNLNVDVMQIEVSKVNSFFENFPDNEGSAAVMEKQTFALANGIEINGGGLTPGSYHQIRLRLRDKDGVTVGELSDPVTVLLEQEHAP